jgi:hypothetical protein
MLAEIFMLRLETMMRESELTARARNNRLVPFPDTVPHSDSAPRLEPPHTKSTWPVT